jgi:hypothetical protein
MKIGGALVVLMVVAVVAGCGSRTVARAEPHRLYTHCGIQWARIDGTFWRATRPQSDGYGNPPRGWSNPFQTGTLVFRSRTTAEFSSSAGSVTFKWTGRARSPVICS